MDTRLRRLERAYQSGDIEAGRAFYLHSLRNKKLSTDVAVLEGTETPSGQIKLSRSGLLSVHRGIPGHVGQWNRRFGYTVTHVPTGLAILTRIRTQALAIDLRDHLEFEHLNDWAFDDDKSPIWEASRELVLATLNAWKERNEWGVR